MAQTTYSRGFSPASPGTPANGFGYRASFLNDEGGAINCGVAVAYKSEGKIENIDAATDVVAGIVMNDMVQDADGLTGDQYAPDQAMVSVLEKGFAYVWCEQSVTPADPVYVRHTVVTTEKLGAFRKDSDSGNARLLKGARFCSAGSTTVAPIVEFDKAADWATTAAAATADAVAALTDNSGGAAADGTIGVITAPTALTDSGGGTADGTVALMTPVTALTVADGAGTNDGTIGAITGDASVIAAVQELAAKIAVSATFEAAAKDNFKELTTAQTANRTALVATADAVKELATKINAVISALKAANLMES